MFFTPVFTVIIVRLLPNTRFMRIFGVTAQLQVSETVLCCQTLKFVTYLRRY